VAGTASDLGAQRCLVLEVLRAAATARAGHPVVGAAVREALRRLPAPEAEVTARLGAAWRRSAVAAPATQAYLDRLAEVAHTWPGGLVAHLSVWSGERNSPASDPVFSAEEQQRVVAERELARRLLGAVLADGTARRDADLVA
jgi:Heme oxygenase